MVRLTDHPDMTLDVYRGRKTTMQHATGNYDFVPFQVRTDCCCPVGFASRDFCAKVAFFC